MWTQKIEYADAEVVLPPPVKKQVWDGEQFVPMTLYKINWLLDSFGHAGIYRDGRYWDYSKAGDFTVMDEKVYAWYQIKWGNR